MDKLFARANDVLSENPPVGQDTLTTNGSDLLWAIFAIMAFTAVVIAAWSFKAPPGERQFYLFNIAVLSTASIAYFSLASDLGLTPVTSEYRTIEARQFSYVRYIDWFITTPLLLSELLLTSGMPTNLILSTVFADIVMIVTGLVGALTVSSYKWGYFVFGCVAMFWVFWNIAQGYSYAKALDARVYKAYSFLSAYLIFLWVLYPVCWGLCEGGNVLNVTSEMIFYGVLDVLAKPVFAILTLLLHTKIPSSLLGLNSEPRMNAIRMEKVGTNLVANKNVDNTHFNDGVSNIPNGNTHDTLPSGVHTYESSNDHNTHGGVQSGTIIPTNNREAFNSRSINSDTTV